VAGAEFTSKDFRTWAGTVLAAEALHQFGKGGLQRGIEHVAKQLGNTKAVCRKCYIHPRVIEACMDGSLAEAMSGRSAEACVKRLLGRRRPRSLVPVLRQSLRRLQRGTPLANAVSRVA
jgi:DNA topoisomerase-1